MQLPETFQKNPQHFYLKNIELLSLEKLPF